MSVERSFEAWEEVQRHGQDLADRLAQGFSGLIQSHMTNPPAFPWPNHQKSILFDLEFPGHSFGKRDFGGLTDNASVNGVSAIFDIGNRIGQAGADFGACLNGLVQQFFRSLPVPFKHEESAGVGLRMDTKRSDVAVQADGELGLVSERLRDSVFVENDGAAGGGGCCGHEGSVDEEICGFDLKSAGFLAKPQGTINISSTYDSRTHNIESSLVARGDLWRVEASNGSSTSGNDNSSLFLVQLGPLLFIRDTTFLLPVHLSKQHLLWYGYDRKVFLICYFFFFFNFYCFLEWNAFSMSSRVVKAPEVVVNVNAMSESCSLCELPDCCVCVEMQSFVDLQFPNGQFTYVSGEGLTTSAFIPFCGGLLQAQGQYPGEMRLSFSCKNKWGTRITPIIQWPDKSFTLGFEQALAWQRSGLMVRPAVQLSLCPTFGGSNPGLRAELIHSVNDHLNLICGCACMTHPSVFASISIGRSKWNGNVGSSGVVVRLDTPLSNVGQPTFSVQINSGVEF